MNIPESVFSEIENLSKETAKRIEQKLVNITRQSDGIAISYKGQTTYIRDSQSSISNTKIR
jgi:hypothetical protein